MFGNFLTTSFIVDSSDLSDRNEGFELASPQAYKFHKQYKYFTTVTLWYCEVKRKENNTQNFNVFTFLIL